MSRKETFLLYIANGRGTFPHIPTEIAGTMEELDTDCMPERKKIVVKVTGNLEKIEIVRWMRGE